MMNSDNQKILDSIYKNLCSLDKTVLQNLSDHIFELMTKGEKKDTSVHSLAAEKDVYNCKKCGSVNLQKFGKTTKGHQRYRCKDCGTVFSSLSTSALVRSQKSADTWKQFIICTLEGRTLNYCAEKCNITVSTAFTWRHKILNALTKEQFADHFSGIVEIDEMFVRVSYKGNHSKSKDFTMPRPAYKRGTDNRSSLGQDKACVLCAAERGKGFSGVVTHRGALNTSILSSVFDGHIEDETIVLTDESHAMKKYFSTKPCGYMALSSSVEGSKKRSVPEVKGPYHINNINTFHGRFRNFLDQYKGVSTKHLNQYLALFLWIENAKKNGTVASETAIDLMLAPDSQITVRNIFRLPLPEIG